MIDLEIINRKAKHDYFVDEVFEAGIVLTGTEIKSIRQGNCNIKDCYGNRAFMIIGQKLFLVTHYQEAEFEPPKSIIETGEDRSFAFDVYSTDDLASELGKTHMLRWS